MRNVIRSQDLTEHNAMVNQPSLLHLGEFNLIIINSRTYVDSWVRNDISDHPDKVALIDLHNHRYPENRAALEALLPEWAADDRDSMVVLFDQFDEVLALQHEVMSGLNSIESYQDFLLRVELENKMEQVESITSNMLSGLTTLRTKWEAKVDTEEKEMLASFGQIRTANIILSVIAVIIGLIVMFVTMRAVKLQAQKQEAINERDMVREQKEIIEEQNREIVDSITYAQRIQNSILPPDDRFSARFKDHFVFYNPRDIVSGDFYWMYELGEDDILVAAADSTGHGVPGAFVSLVCYNSLNASIKEHHKDRPCDILDKSAELVKEAFSQQGADVKDGMDIALVRVRGKSLQYSGANNSGYIRRGDEWIELKACRQPVGMYENMKPFEITETELQEGDKVYLFTDGFVDQFGGPKGKKYKKPNFLKLLESVQHLSMNDQRTELLAELTRWRGDLDQIDDVLVIGLTI